LLLAVLIIRSWCPDRLSALNETALIAAASACEEIMTWPTQPGSRFSAMESAGLGHARQDNIGFLLSSMHGRLVYNRYWRIIAGVYQSADAHLHDDDLRAAQSADAISRRIAFSASRALHRPVNAWQVANFPAVISGNSVRRTAPRSQGRRTAHDQLAHHGAAAGPHRAPEVPPGDHGATAMKLTAWQCRQATRSSSSRALRLGQQAVEVGRVKPAIDTRRVRRCWAST